MSVPWKPALKMRLEPDCELSLLHRQKDEVLLNEFIKVTPRFAARPFEYAWCGARIFPSQSVLDVGTGGSIFPKIMAKLGRGSYVCVDPSPKLEPNPAYETHRIDVLKWDDSRTFDVVACISVLEHVQNDTEIVQNIVSRLKSGGTLLITTPYTHWEMQEDKRQPQRYYSVEGLFQRIIKPSECTLVDWNFVHYEWPGGKPYLAPPNNAGVALLAFRK